MVGDWYKFKEVNMGDVEVDICDICGEKHTLQRKYYYYGIKCQCHSPEHFEIVRHCSTCIPKPPEKTTIHITPKGE